MFHTLDHTAHRGRVFEHARTAHFVETESLESGELPLAPSGRAGDLRHLDALSGRRPRGRLLGRSGWFPCRLVLILRHRLLPCLGGRALAQYFAHLLAAALRHRARADRAVERFEGCLDHVMRIGCADRLRHHVLDAERLENGAHRTAGDDAGARLRGAQHHLAGTVMTDDVVMKRAALAQRNPHQAAARLFGRLADRLRHFARLARAVADAALTVADDDHGGAAEAAPALHHLGDAIDADEFFDKFAVGSIAVAVARPAFARRTVAAFAAFASPRGSACARRRACARRPPSRA